MAGMTCCMLARDGCASFCSGTEQALLDLCVMSSNLPLRHQLVNHCASLSHATALSGSASSCLLRLDIPESGLGGGWLPVVSSRGGFTRSFSFAAHLHEGVSCPRPYCCEPRSRLPCSAASFWTLPPDATVRQRHLSWTE